MVDVVYMPTTDHLDDEEEEMYDTIEEIPNLRKGNDYQIVLRYCNAAVGEGSHGWLQEGLDLAEEIREETC